MAAELDFRHVSAEHGDGAELLAAMIAEMRELYWDVRGGLDLNAPDMPAAGPAEMGPPGGAFLVGYRDGQPVCGGGIKRLPDGACEIKRMYVVPAARGQGVARALLRALEVAARGLGYDTVRLDTGPRQPHAQGLYESEGYVAVGNFNGNPVATFFGEKQLAGYSGDVFTGIVEELGEVVGREDLTDSVRMVIRGPVVTTDARHGDSIAVNGVCLTVVEVLPDGVFTADVMGETLNRSSLRGLRAGSPVNLERAAAVNSRLGGHIVQGHVDGTGHVIARTRSEHWEVVRIALPMALSRYVVEKGSITVDGVSLTVSGLGHDWFEVSLIPTTLGLTTLGRAEVGAHVNLEVDIIAKYVERLLSHDGPAD